MTMYLLENKQINKVLHAIEFGFYSHYQETRQLILKV